VVGIVASRLVGRFGKPAVVLSVENGHAKGSGRSVGSVDLFELVAGCREHLSGFGGHKMAVGLALASDRIAAFREALCKQASRLDPMLYKPDLGILGELPLSEIDWELMEILQRYEPYGEANGKPKFLIKNISVIDANPIGSEKNHLKMVLGDGTHTLSAVWFRFEKEVAKHHKIDVSGTLQVNEFNGNRTIQLLVEKIE
jgi:single-stranded-DNA-specific exonuclease